MKKPELLAPAGDMERLEAAIIYGADAVYVGGKQFGLRMRAANFDAGELKQAVALAHASGVKLYVTVNIFARNADLTDLPEHLLFLESIGVDAIIVADPGVLALAKKTAPGLAVHLSTQANTTNREAAAFWAGQGVSRIVLARELSLQEIIEIKESVDTELEVFVHGAMCISYSGRCLLSSHMTGRDANQGDCAQACRWKYHLVEEKRPGQYFPVWEDDRGTYILSSRDLCLLSRIPDLIKAGVGCFKIEGRVKSVHYVATVTKVYRQAIDRYMAMAGATVRPVSDDESSNSPLKQGGGLAGPGQFSMDPSWLEELGKVSNREYITDFLKGQGSEAGHGRVEALYCRPYTFVGMVQGYDQQRGLALVQQRNRFCVGEKLELLTPRGPNLELTVEKMYDGQGELIEAAPHPCQEVLLPMPQAVPRYSLLRR